MVRLKIIKLKEIKQRVLHTGVATPGIVENRGKESTEAQSSILNIQRYM